MSLRYASRVFMRSIQGLKDRTSGSSSKAVFGGFKPSQAKPASESAGNTSQQVRCVSCTGDTAKKVAAAAEESRRLRGAEKAEKVMHIICWGPHLI